MVNAGIDDRDVQGLVRFGYAHLPEACFLLLEIENAAASRSWLGTITQSLTTAERLSGRPKTALQVAFSRQGLQALGVPEGMIRGFSPEFISGMSGEESRSRRLGDVQSNAPSTWLWGGPSNVPHLILMLYADTGALEGWQKSVVGKLPQGGVKLLRHLGNSVTDGYEPFGFRDGMSQPEIDWRLERQVGSKDQLEYGNLVSAGEWLLGYANEYGKYTDRPLVDPKDDPENKLLSAEEQPDKKDLGRNGAYLVFRQLEQNVPGFWQFLDTEANHDPRERRKLAETMVGRTMEGEPLVSLASSPIAGIGPDPDDIRLNQFTYESDADGIRCPFGAHIRRANPRNPDLPYGTKGFLSWLIRTAGFGRKSIRDDVIASTRFHRILRRGRRYGKRLSPEEAIQMGKADSEERGIYFICLNANIGRQFEFVQNAWIIGTKFNGLTEESDPLIGNRELVPGCPATNTFSIPQESGVRQRITGMPQFVTVRGGAYFFLPSIRALRYFTGIG
jgi:Dyp-type peroxidase family